MTYDDAANEAPSLPGSIEELRSVAQPPTVLARRNAEHWLSLVYGRRLSIYLTFALLRIGVTANTVTTAMLVVGILGAALFGLPGLASAVIGALMIQLYLVLDCSDGEVARWSSSQSALGVYLDRVSHYLVEAAIFVAFGVRLGASFGDDRVLIGAITALLAILVKVEGDLIAFSRTSAGLGPDRDREPEFHASSALGTARRIVSAFGIHRLLGAVEASIAMLVTVTIGALWWPQAESILQYVFLAIAAFMVPAHLASVIASDRLK